MGKVIPLESRDSRQEVFTVQEVAAWLKVTPRRVLQLGIPCLGATVGGHNARVLRFPRDVIARPFPSALARDANHGAEASETSGVFF
jgi:hypothetical protein